MGAWQHSQGAHLSPGENFTPRRTFPFQRLSWSLVISSPCVLSLHGDPHNPRLFGYLGKYSGFLQYLSLSKEKDSLWGTEVLPSPNAPSLLSLLPLRVPSWAPRPLQRLTPPSATRT